MRLFFFLIIFFQSLFAVAMYDPPPLPYDPSVPARWQCLLDITARYLMHDPLKLKDLAEEDKWIHFYAYYIHFSFLAQKYDESLGDEEIPEALRDGIFLDDNYLDSYLEAGKKNEPYWFSDNDKKAEGSMTMIEGAKNDKKPRAFMLNCKALNRRALIELVEEKLQFKMAELEKLEQQSYKFEKVYNAERERKIAKNRLDMGNVIVPIEFKRSYKPPLRVIMPESKNFSMSESKNFSGAIIHNMPAPKPKKKKKKSWDCTGLTH